MYYLVFILFITALYLYSFVRPMVKGAIYFPTKKKAIDAVVRLCEEIPNAKVADLGSGDGRILMAFGKHKICIDGFEINPFLYLLSKFLIGKAGLAEYAHVHYKNLWKVDLTEYDVVVVFGIDYIMKDLKKKFKDELRPDALILSNVFKIPDVKGDRVESFYVYKARDLK